ncbi:D123-domain-containing protein, partial [Thamnocephalis sphaerospora]
VSDCAFPAWYTRFRRHTIASKVVPLPPDFVDYLLADGIFLPTNSTQLSILRATFEELSTDDEAEDSSDSDDNEDVDAAERQQQRVREAIRQLGGEVLPKLNWSAPKASLWISTTRSMRCTTAEEVFLLLKSSDVVVHDLLHAYDTCDIPPAERPQPVLVLREWRTLNPAHEFRCFVRDHQLIGISQRDPAHYPFLADAQQEIRHSIRQFYQNAVKESFGHSDYVFDVYLHDPSRRDGRVQLVDFGPFGGPTNPLLFEWSE